MLLRCWWFSGEKGKCPTLVELGLRGNHGGAKWEKAWRVCSALAQGKCVCNAHSSHHRPPRYHHVWIPWRHRSVVLEWFGTGLLCAMPALEPGGFGNLVWEPKLASTVALYCRDQSHFLHSRFSTWLYLMEAKPDWSFPFPCQFCPFPYPAQEQDFTTALQRQIQTSASIFPTSWASVFNHWEVDFILHKTSSLNIWKQMHGKAVQMFTANKWKPGHPRAPPCCPEMSVQALFPLCGTSREHPPPHLPIFSWSVFPGKEQPCMTLRNQVRSLL